MTHQGGFPESESPAVQTYLLGQLSLRRLLRLQERIAMQIGSRDDGQICLLLCEHPEIVTVGRGGSPEAIRAESGLLRRRQIDVRWVKRGGGCILHAPGQLAVYSVVPLDWHGFSPGEYLDRLQGGLLRCLEELGIGARTQPARHGLWGRTGQLVAMGVAIRDGVSRHGAFINVCPAMGLFRLVESDPVGLTSMSCLVAERQQPVKMTKVRAEVVRHLTAALGCDRYHLYTGHPWLRAQPASP